MCQILGMAAEYRRRIADGTKNYGQALRLVLTLSDLHDHEEPAEAEPDGQE